MRRSFAEERAYREGYQDGFAVSRKAEEVMRGTDPTKYLFVGGPADGEHKQTRGERVVRVPDYPPLPVFAYLDSDPLTDDCVIRVAQYERRTSSKGFSFYVYTGTR